MHGGLQSPNIILVRCILRRQLTVSLSGRLKNDGEMKVHVDGPYGDSGERPAWLKHSVLAIFAGGIGVLSCTSQQCHAPFSRMCQRTAVEERIAVCLLQVDY